MGLEDGGWPREKGVRCGENILKERKFGGQRLGHTKVW